MTIKCSFFFYNNCYIKLLKLIGGPNPNKLHKDLYHSKKLIKGINMNSEKIDVCRNNYILFLEGAQENKCLKCGKLRYVEIINDDGEIVTIEVAHKQLFSSHRK
jgi:hypothetical protein